MSTKAFRCLFENNTTIEVLELRKCKVPDKLLNLIALKMKRLKHVKLSVRHSSLDRFIFLSALLNWRIVFSGSSCAKFRGHQVSSAAQYQCFLLVSYTSKSAEHHTARSPDWARPSAGAGVVRSVGRHSLLNPCKICTDEIDFSTKDLSACIGNFDHDGCFVFFTMVVYLLTKAIECSRRTNYSVQWFLIFKIARVIFIAVGGVTFCKVLKLCSWRYLPLSDFITNSPGFPSVQSALPIVHCSRLCR